MLFRILEILLGIIVRNRVKNMFGVIFKYKIWMDKMKFFNPFLVLGCPAKLIIRAAIDPMREKW